MAIFKIPHLERETLKRTVKCTGHESINCTDMVMFSLRRFAEEPKNMSGQCLVLDRQWIGNLYKNLASMLSSTISGR